MAPIEEPWAAALGDVYRASLLSARSSNNGSRRSSTASSSNNNSNNSESDCSPSRERWGSVKTWMFGHMLASSFAKVSLDSSAASSRSSSDARESSRSSSSHSTSTNNTAAVITGTNDWGVCYSISGSSSVGTRAAGTNDWDACYSTSSVKPCVSASSSSSTLCADIDEAERSETPPTPLSSINTNSSSTSISTGGARLVFDLVRVIGSGSYGTVYLSRVRGSQQLVAIKSVDKRKLAQRAQSARDTQRLRTERHVLCAVGAHPFVTTLLCSFETSASVNFVLEYCAGGDLYYLLEKCAQHRLSEPHVAFYAASIALTLQHVHARGIVYRDLKPENVLLDRDGFVRLADFGFARPGVSRTDQQRCTTFCGSADYIAPEVVRGAGYGMAADVWSLGCVVYELLTGFPPFYCPTDRSLLFRKIETAAVAFPPHLSPQVCDLLAGLLHKDATQRLTLDAVVAHPFFAAIDWYALATKQVVPPRVPTLADPLDTSNFEAQFTAQRVDGSSLVFAESEPQNCCPDDTRLFDDFDWCCDDAERLFG